MEYPAHHPILFASRWVATDLDTDITAIDRPDLCAEYHSLRASAPSRHRRGKTYFVGHDGFPSTTKPTTRLEEHAAIALCNLQRHWQHPRGGGFRFLDYQFPLQSQRADKGIGKIDLIGVSDHGQLLITELKLEGKNNNRGDPPPSALMEALRYAAIVEANLHAIAGEAQSRFGITVQQSKPAIQLLATRTYWHAWKHCRAAGNWQQALATLMDDIKTDLDISVDCLALDDFHITPGHGSEKPRIDPPPDLHPAP